MSMQEVRSRFEAEIRKRAAQDHYIDRAQEREVLQSALDEGIAADSARALLAAACEAQQYILESRVIKQLQDYLETAADNDGQIDQKEYRDGLALARKWTHGRRSEAQCQGLLVEIIEDAGYKTSRGWFGSWYDRVKKEVARQPVGR